MSIEPLKRRRPFGAALRPYVSLRRRRRRRVKGGRFLPGASEPSTRCWRCLTYAGEGEGPTPDTADKLFGCSIGKAAMWARLIVIVPPAFQLLPCVRQVKEHLAVQTFVPESSVEAFDVRL